MAFKVSLCSAVVNSRPDHNDNTVSLLGWCHEQVKKHREKGEILLLLHLQIINTDKIPALYKGYLTTYKTSTVSQSVSHLVNCRMWKWLANARPFSLSVNYYHIDTDISLHRPSIHPSQGSVFLFTLSFSCSCYHLFRDPSEIPKENLRLLIWDPQVSAGRTFLVQLFS